MFICFGTLIFQNLHILYLDISYPHQFWTPALCREVEVAVKMRFFPCQNLWPGWERAAYAARWEILPFLPREGTDAKGGELFFVPVYSWWRPQLPTADVLTVLKVLPGLFMGRAEQPHSKHSKQLVSPEYSSYKSPQLPQTSGILGCASWWGWDALDLQAPPAESCLKLSQFENSTLEADKNSARFHTVPVEAGGADGSLQAA